MENLKEIHRKTAGGWEKIRMSELRKGDLFRMDEHEGIFQANADPYLNDDDVSVIEAKETNE